MKKIILACAILFLASCTENKIGYVDNVKLMDEYQHKKDVESKYKAQAEKLAKRRDSITQAFQNEAQQFQAAAEKMAPATAQQKYTEMQQRGQAIGQQLQMEEQGLQAQGQTEMDSIVKTVKEAIQKYGKDNGYTYILGGGDGGSVLYGDNTMDLTEPILDILNKKE